MKKLKLIAGLTAALGAALAGILVYTALHSSGQVYVEIDPAVQTQAQAPLETEAVKGSQTEPADEGGMEETAVPQTQAPEPVRLIFGGDVLLSDYVLSAYDQAGGISGVLDQGFQSLIRQGDLFVVNEEFPFSTRGTPAPDKQYTFRLAPERVSILQEMGVDLVTLANNHALDYGQDSLTDTLDTLDHAGILHVGAGRNLDQAKAPAVVEIQGRTIGFLGATRVIPEVSWNAGADTPGMLATYDPAQTLEEIEKASQTCDYVVVYVHWGIERDELPQDYQRTMGKQYIDAGADLVIGSHPHVLQGVEFYQGKPIVYSLGNFVFGSSIPRTALLQVEWDGQETQLTLIPGTSSMGYTRQLTEAEDLEEFARYMTGISFGVEVDSQGRVLPLQGE